MPDESVSPDAMPETPAIAAPAAEAAAVNAAPPGDEAPPAAPPTPSMVRLVPLTAAARLQIDMYAAITGREPVLDLALAEAVRLKAREKSSLKLVADAVWSPKALWPELRRTCYKSFVKSAHHPQVAAFIRRLSQSAVRQIAGERKYAASRPRQATNRSAA